MRSNFVKRSSTAANAAALWWEETLFDINVLEETEGIRVFDTGPKHFRHPHLPEIHDCNKYDEFENALKTAFSMILNVCASLDFVTGCWIRVKTKPDSLLKICAWDAGFSNNKLLWPTQTSMLIKDSSVVVFLQNGEELEIWNAIKFS